MFWRHFKIYSPALLLLGFFIYPLVLWAAPASSHTFSISPARQELELAAGQTKIFNLKVTNLSTEAEHFSLSIKDLYPDLGGTGFTFSPNSIPASQYLFSRLDLSYPEQLTILPGETKFIPIAISVPETWPPGSLHGLLNLTLDQSGLAGTAKLNTSAGAIVLIRLAGPVKESGRLLRFNALATWLASSARPSLQIAYQNDGNVYLNPYGVITLKNWRGVAIQKNYVEPWFVLPGAIRNREITIAPLAGHWRPGFYRAQLDLNLGFNNQLSSASTYFVISPNPWILVLILAIIGGLLYLGFKIKKHV